MPDKNIRPLAGHPLIAYTIAVARASAVFERVVLSTDSDMYRRIGEYYGAEAPFLRPPEMATSTSPDIEWVQHALAQLDERYDCFSLLRPTSPFRQAETIRRAWHQFCTAGKTVDSLRAVEKVTQHPGKMWVIHGERMAPLLLNPRGVPWHSSQYQALPEVYVQNASLEIAWTRVVDAGSISGEVLIPFFTSELEGFDINNQLDWRIAEAMVSAGEATLPYVDQSPYPG